LLASWLIVFDNADNFEVLHDYWPSTENGAILMTGRDLVLDHLAKSNSTMEDGIDVEPLSSEDDSNLMINLARYENRLVSKTQSLELAVRLGGLPLAIARIAAMIRWSDLTFNEFLDLFAEGVQDSTSS
jgi:hypothetical protein